MLGLLSADRLKTDAGRYVAPVSVLKNCILFIQFASFDAIFSNDGEEIANMFQLPESTSHYFLNFPQNKHSWYHQANNAEHVFMLRQVVDNEPNSPQRHLRAANRSHPLYYFVRFEYCHDGNTVLIPLILQKDVSS